MSFVVIVSIPGRPNDEQPEPFFLDVDAEWPAVEALLLTMMGDDSDGKELDVRYWDDEDFVILSSQEELEEAFRIARHNGLLPLFVRWTDSDALFIPPNEPWTPPLADATDITDVVIVNHDALFSPQAAPHAHHAPPDTSNNKPEEEDASYNKDAPGSTCLQEEDVFVPISLLQMAKEAAVDAAGGLSTALEAAPGPEESSEEAGAACDPQHKIVPGAPSGANVIAIEMPECPVDLLIVQGTNAARPQGTEAAEPAEMAETGEISPKSGRDAETGFWMVSKHDLHLDLAEGGDASSADAADLILLKNKVTRASKPRSDSSARPGGASGSKAGKPACHKASVPLKKETGGHKGSRDSKAGHPKSEEQTALIDSPERRGDRKAERLTSHMFVSFMTKYKSELRREIQKDLHRITVPEITEALRRVQLAVDTDTSTANTQEHQAPQKWPVAVHYGITCDHCERTIVGPRFMCGNCVDYDLCAACEDLQPCVHDASHVFVKLRRPHSKAGFKHNVKAPLLKRPVYPPATHTEGPAEESSKAALSQTEKQEKRKARLAEKLRLLSEEHSLKEDRLKRKLQKIHRPPPPQHPLLFTLHKQAGFAVLRAELVCDSGARCRCYGPNQKVVKTFELSNTGTVAWPADTKLKSIVTKGDKVKSEDIGTVEGCCGQVTASSKHVGAVQPSASVTVTVHFFTPPHAGAVEAAWQLHCRKIPFGPVLACHVQVQLDADQDAAQCVRGDKPAGEVKVGEVVTPDLGLHVQASPLMPSTPNNTPFGVSPPSGRCYSPGPECESQSWVGGQGGCEEHLAQAFERRISVAVQSMQKAEQPQNLLDTDLNLLTASGHCLPLIPLTPSQATHHPALIAGALPAAKMPATQEVEPQSPGEQEQEPEGCTVTSIALDHGFYAAPPPPASIQSPVSAGESDDAAEEFVVLAENLSSASSSADSDEFCVILPDCFDLSKPLLASTACQDVLQPEPVSVQEEALSSFGSLELLSMQQFTPLQQKEGSAESDGQKDSPEPLGEQEEANAGAEAQPEVDAAKEQAQLIAAEAAKEGAQLIPPQPDEQGDGDEAPALEGSRGREAGEGPEPAEGTQKSADTEAEPHHAEDRERAHNRSAAEEGASQSPAELNKGADIEADPDQTDTAVKEAHTQADTQPTVVQVLDPGQQLNQLMSSTLRAVSGGLQGLYNTTRGVFHTIQSPPSEEQKGPAVQFPKSTWQPSTVQYVPPRNDYRPPTSHYQPPTSHYQPPTSHYQPPKSDFRMPESSPPGGGGGEAGGCPAVEPQYRETMRRVREMGYFNTARVYQLVQQHSGDLQTVVHHLCEEADNDWAARRH